MEDIKCPVCGKPGIPDYHKEDVVCPQCKSDLSIYRIIDKVTTKKSGFIWKAISAVALLATAVCAYFLFTKPSNSKTDIQSTELSVLRDSLITLKTELKSAQKTENTNNSTEQPENSYNYIVRSGESFCSISKKFYGTESKALEIAERNGRDINSPIFIGDTLKID